MKPKSSFTYLSFHNIGKTVDPKAYTVVETQQPVDLFTIAITY